MRGGCRGLLEVGQSAGFGAVGVGRRLDLLVASEAEGVRPGVEVHGFGVVRCVSGGGRVEGGVPR